MDFYLFNIYLGKVVQSVTWMFRAVRNCCQVLSRKQVHEGVDKMAHQHTKGMTFHFCYWSWNHFELVNFHCIFSIDLQEQLNSLLHVELWRLVVIFRRINNYFLILLFILSTTMHSLWALLYAEQGELWHRDKQWSDVSCKMSLPTSSLCQMGLLDCFTEREKGAENGNWEPIIVGL